MKRRIGNTLLTIATAAAALLALPAAAENEGPLRRPSGTVAAPEVLGNNVDFFAITVNADGTASTPTQRIGGVTVVKNAGFTGAYEVTIPRGNLHRRCHYTASIVSRIDGVQAPGFVTINSLSGTNNGLYVTTSDVAGVRTDLPFALQVMCRPR